MKFSSILCCAFMFSICVPHSESRLRSRCQRQTALSDDNQSKHTIPRGCKAGSLTWHYPFGSIYVHFRPSNPRDREFWVCVKDGLATEGMTAFDVSDGTSADLPDISRSYATCVPPVNGKVIIKWDSASERRYMANIRYWVVRLPPV